MHAAHKWMAIYNSKHLLGKSTSVQCIIHRLLNLLSGRLVMFNVMVFNPEMGLRPAFSRPRPMMFVAKGKASGL